jgi:transcriptional regulator with XRE-family HTH domain
VRAQHSNKYGAFALALRQRREGAGLSQAELAERIGKVQSHVAKIESGERLVNVVELVKLAELYRISPEDLLRPLLKK